MGKKSPAPPPAPDYAGAAQQQGIANLEAARLTARLSNPNIRTPLGGQRVSWGRANFDQRAYDAAMADWNRRNPQQPSGVQNGLSFSGGQSTKPNRQPPDGTSISTYGKPNAAPPTTDIGGGAAMPTGGQELKVGGAPLREGFGPMRGGFEDREYTMGGPAQQRAAQMGGDLGISDTGMMGRVPTISPAMGGPAMRDTMMRDTGMRGGQTGGDFAEFDGFTGRGPGGRAGQDFGGYTGDAMPTREMFTTMTDLDTPYIEQYLTPEAQATLEAQQRVERALAGLGEGAINRVQDIYGQNFTPTGLPAQQFAFDRGALPTLGPLEGRATADVSALPVNFGPTGGQFGMATGGPAGPQLQGQLNTQGLAAMPVNAGVTAQEAILSRLDPSLQRQRAQLETQLANQGLARGGEAYDVAMQEQAQRENDLRTQAALQGLQLDMAARQQGFGEAQALGGFANQAALQGFGAGQQATAAQNAAIAQNFGQALQGQGAYNAAAAQQFGQGMDVQAARNAAVMANQQAQLQQAQAMAALQAQGFNQSQAAAAFQNAQRQAALQEQLALRNQPLNEIAALMGGAQVQMPQFQAYQGAEVAAAPIFGATQAAGNFALQNYGNQVNAYNARMGLYGNIAGAAGAFAGGR